MPPTLGSAAAPHGWSTHASPSTAYAASGPTWQDWKESAELLWSDLPRVLRWGIGVSLVALVVVIGSSVVDPGTETATPAAPPPAAPPGGDAADRADDPVGDTFDVIDDGDQGSNPAFRALSTDDQGVCEDINIQFAVAAADDELLVSEVLDITNYAYRYSDYGGALEAAAQDLLQAMADAADGFADGDDVADAGRELLHLCDYSA